MPNAQDELKAKIVKRPLAFEVLRQIGQEKNPTLTSLAQRLKRTPPTIHEALALLEKERLIEGEKSGREKIYRVKDKNVVRSLTSDPAIQDEINQSLYRLQGEPVFLMGDFVSELDKQLSASGHKVTREAKIKTPLGQLELDFVIESANGGKTGIEIKRVRYPKHIQGSLSNEFGRLRAALRSGPGLDKLVLVLLLPRDKGDADFDEWAYKDMLEQESTPDTQVEVVMEHVDDSDLRKPSFVKWLTEEIRVRNEKSRRTA